MKHLKQQSGFTLLEIAVVVAISAILIASALNQLTPLLQAKTEVAAMERLNKAALAVSAAYRVNARQVENTALREFRLSPTITVVDSSNASNANTKLALASISTYGQVSPNDLEIDEYARFHTYFVSNRLSFAMPGGYSIFYRKIAIVSSGYNSKLDPGTVLDGATGNLTLGGDDLGVVIDGFQIQKDLTDRTVASVNKLSNAYQNYFTNRYLANPSRDVSINYFASTGVPVARWDSSGLAGNSGGAFADAPSLNFGQALGLSAADMLDAYGSPIQVDNSSNLTRNPNNTTTAMQIPPYSAVISAQLMSGQFYKQSAIGGF